MTLIPNLLIFRTMPATRDTLAGRPTFKENLFAKEYIKKRGNGKQAALISYDCTPMSAEVIASENLSKPRVQLAIASELERLEIDSLDEKDIAAGIYKEALSAKNAGDRLKALELLAKWRAMLTEKREIGKPGAFKAKKNLDGVSTKEILEELGERLKLSSAGVNTTQEDGEPKAVQSETGKTQ